ncbi:Uncharacterized protein Fot_01298 [Forsythia ovata]|uniref:Uncharacterized protein n=1 Tax=Forsythia ovata TaxID=205694 RepID=A0ABD1X3K9_9LAMI
MAFNGQPNLVWTLGSNAYLNNEEPNDEQDANFIKNFSKIAHDEIRSLIKEKFGGAMVMPQLAPRLSSSDCTLLCTRSCLQSDCSIPNKIQPQVPTRIRTPTLPLEASLMLIVPLVELCPRDQQSQYLF